MAKSVVVPVITTIDSKGINSAISQLGKLGTSMKNLGRAVAGSVVVNKIGQFMADATIQARDYERNIAALTTVFGDFTPQMKGFVDASTELGMSQTDAAKSATFLGSVLKQAGLPMKDVAGQTQNLVKLATDLATTYGYDVSEALTGMTALFRGEYDPIEKFGVAMKQSEVNAVLAANGQNKLTGAAKRNAEQMARLALLYDRSRDAQGAFTRQGDSLFVKQAKLTAAFDNFKIAVGQNLIPVLSDVATKLAPLFTALLPTIGQVFKKVGELIAVLAQSFLPDATGNVSTLATAFMGLLDVLKFLVPIVSKLAIPILSLVAAFKTYNLLLPIATLFTGGFAAAEGTATAATKTFTAALRVNPIIAAISAIVALTVAFQGLNAAAGSTNPEAMFKNIPKDIEAKMAAAGTAASLNYRKLNPQDIQGAIKAGKAAQQAFLARWQAGQAELNRNKAAGTIPDDFQKLLDGLLKNFNGAAGAAGAAAGKAAMSWFDKLAEEFKKQQYVGKLKKLGLSDALINSVIGSGEAWQSVADKIISTGAEFAQSLQETFNQTKDGLEEIAALAEAAAKKAAETQAYIDEMMKPFTDVNLLNIGVAAMGEYETAVKSLFDNISDSLKQGFADKKLSQDAFTWLSGYASKQADILLEKAKAIDVLTKKIEIARSTTQSVLGGADITQALSSESSQVTESFKQMRDGIEITISRTVDVVKNNSLASAYKALVEKTKTFAKNLVSLKALGLNPNLFKQILSAGADAGGAVAQAIVDGGSGTVSELNDLFSQLDSAASDIAANSTDLLYGLGEDTTNSYISGLLSQKDALVAAADELIKAFQTAFQTQLQLSLGVQSAGVAGTGWAADVSAANAQAYMNFRRGEQATPVVVNVNANVVKSEADLGLVVYDAIQAAKRSGVVGAGVL